MLKSTFIALAAAISLSAATPVNAHDPVTPEAAPAITKSGHIAVDGVNYYYEVRGEGEPLLLLHGGLGSIDMFGPVLPALTEGRQVIGVDLQGHGRTELGDRPLSLKAMGDDMEAIARELGHEQVDVLPAGL